LNLLTKKKLYSVGKLGKPHSLKGYQYINIEYFFREFDLNDIILHIENSEYKVQDFKKHLKNRNLIKFYSFDSIESISNFRDKSVMLSADMFNLFINKDNLPWPGFFIGKNLNDKGYKFVNYEILENIYFCEIEGIDDMKIPYNSNFFKFIDENLVLLDSGLII
tara:strand:+ start:71 stop:562 length:492 start_codon:yes stop_codon:yes gene_type:complete